MLIDDAEFMYAKTINVLTVLPATLLAAIPVFGAPPIKKATFRNGKVTRLAIGDNWESGGTNRSSNGELLLFLPGATLTADGKTLVESGAFVAH